MIRRAFRNRSFLRKVSVPFIHLLSAFAKRPERSIHSFFVGITLLIVGFLVSNTINARNAAHAVLHGKAAEAGHVVADGVALQIRAHFHDLMFLRDSFLQKGSGTLIPSAKALAVFTAFRQTHPAIIAINIQNPAGHLIVWSSQKPSSHPIIASDKVFHALQDDPNQSLGTPFFDTRDQTWVLPLRERFRDNEGRVLGFIGSPFLLSRMSSIQIPPMIQGVVLSLSDGKAISLWKDGHWFPPGLPLPRPVDEITTPIPGLPWIVRTQWDAATLAHLFWENEWPYLLLTFLLLLITAATDTATQIAYARIRQLHEYQKAALHIQQSLINLKDAEEMYRLVVDTIVVKTKAISAYVALPEPGAEWLRITAARADDSDLQKSLAQMKIPLDSTHLPYGNLLPARCFREKVSLGPLDPQEHAAMAEVNGIPAPRRVRSVMAYPIFLSDSPDPFALLMIESDTRHHFTPALQNLLAQMVQSVGAALTQSRHHQQLQQLAHFSVLLSSANEAIAHMENEADLLQTLCALTVQHTNIRLAWIARPGERGVFKSLAAAGAVDYLEDICISVSAESPEGQGPVGQSWRDQQAVYNVSFTKSPHMHPWVQRAQAFGMGASASLPIYRGGKLWAVLAVYRGEERIFEADLRKILEDLAKDVGYGLDRLDILRKEREANAFNEVLLNVQTSGINVMRYPERIIERINARMLEMFGVASMEDVVGHPIREFFSEEEIYAGINASTQTVLKEGHGTVRDVPYRRMDGCVIYMDLSGQRLDEPDGVERILWTCVDVTERHQLMGELAQQALFDMLTGLPNRRALDAELEKAMARADRHEYLLGVVMMDLDGFKLVNDTYGHETGDLVLRSVGQHLREGVRRTDFVARLGGDEFVLLLEDCISIEEINITLEKIGGVVRQPIDLPDGNKAEIDLSAGMSIYPTDDGINNPDTLLRYADQALYKCKSHKTDRLHFWTLYGEPVPLRLNAVQKQLRNGELLVHYQPVLDTHSHQIVGVEALARLRNEDGRILHPGEFLPLLTAENVTDLSWMVLTQALTDLAGLDALGWSLWVSFNVAQESFDDRCVRCLAGVMGASGIDPSRITLEILGDSNFLERNAALSVLHDIKDLGIRLALDDVGSACFSLLRLKALPIDEIKLDQGFIRLLEERPQDLDFIASIRDLAVGMGVDLVVEGIETDEILDAISVMGIRLLQGYAIAKPMPVTQLREFLVQRPFYHRQHPTSLLGLYAKQVSDQGALKKVILDNPLLINSDELAEASRCVMDEHMRRLGLAENSLLFGLHWEVHRAIASLLKAPVIGDWERVKQTQKAFADGLLEAFQKTKC